MTRGTWTMAAMRVVVNEINTTGVISRKNANSANTVNKNANTKLANNKANNSTY